MSLCPIEEYKKTIPLDIRFNIDFLISISDLVDTSEEIKLLKDIAFYFSGKRHTKNRSDKRYIKTNHTKAICLLDAICDKCDEFATYLLLGKEDNFIELYCFKHLEEHQEKLESKYTFDEENKFIELRKAKQRTATCQFCGNKFKTYKRNQKFCKRRCRRAFFTKSYYESKD